MWLDEDQDAAVAYEQWLAADRARRCPSCGTTPEDSIDPESGRELRDPMWRVEIHHCHVCEALADAREDADGPGLSARLVPNIDDENEDDGDLHPD